MIRTAFILLFLLSWSTLNAQIGMFISERMGREKLHPLLSIDYKISKSSRIGVYGFAGTLSKYNYKVPTYTISGSTTTTTGDVGFDMPYSQGFDGIPQSGYTRMSGWGIGMFYSNDIPLKLKDKHNLYWSIESHYGQLNDTYHIVYLQGTNENIYEGTFKYATISIGTKFGYRYFFNKLFIQSNIGANYYYPIIPNINAYAWGYSHQTPFVGVEFELDLGIGIAF